jgi:hypothetical protein
VRPELFEFRAAQDMDGAWVVTETYGVKHHDEFPVIEKPEERQALRAAVDKVDVFIESSGVLHSLQQCQTEAVILKEQIPEAQHQHWRCLN